MKNKFALLMFPILFSTFLISCGSVSNNNNTNSNSSTNSNTSSENKEVLPIDNTKQFEEKTTSEGTNITKTEKSIRIYLYDGVEDKLYYKSESVEVTDGALVTAIIDSLKKDRGENFCTLPSDLGVKNAKLDTENDNITIDFGSKFVNNMNLGSSAEINVLKAIVNSIGYNFGVNKVYITVDGAAYSSGHISMDDGEPFKVDYENTTELK